MIICDVDNVLNDDRWRRTFINPAHEDPQARFHTYHSMSCHDWSFNKHLVDVDCEVWLLTCMPERYRPLRESWLREHKINYDQLLMRANRDGRSSPRVKSDMVRHIKALRDLKKVLAAYDDRDDVCLMYERDYGLPAEKVFVNAEEYQLWLDRETPPPTLSTRESMA